MLLRTSTVIAMTVAFMFGGAVGAVALLPSGSLPLGQRAGKPIWTEVAWPFLADEWEIGRAHV